MVRTFSLNLADAAYSSLYNRAADFRRGGRSTPLTTRSSSLRTGVNNAAATTAAMSVPIRVDPTGMRVASTSETTFSQPVNNRNISAVVHEYSTQPNVWMTLDTWSSAGAGATRELLDGRFGFFLPGAEEIAISNFRYYPPMPPTAPQAR